MTNAYIPTTYEREEPTLRVLRDTLYDLRSSSEGHDLVVRGAAKRLGWSRSAVYAAINALAESG